MRIGREASSDMGRMAPLTREALDAEQRRVYDAVVAGPRREMNGPVPFWLKSPGLADAAQRLGAWLRFESQLPPSVRELAILVTARAMTAQVEWHLHRPIAEQAGLSPHVIGAIAARTPPDLASDDEALTYAIAERLTKTHALDDELYARGLLRFGERGMVELVALVGYYTLVALTLNAFEATLPDGAGPPLDP
ncbi:MAG: carboxymuconolactone decarboxylase family protein [Acetobacteraceae bacterium]